MFLFFWKLGISGQFPSEYVTAVVSGQALGGVFTAIIEIMTITFASDPRDSALVFFIIGNALLVMSLVAYISMARMKFFKYFTTNRSGALSPKNSRLQLQRQPSTMEPVFREVLNKMWMYGFTEWMVRRYLFNLNEKFRFTNFLFVGICCHTVCVSLSNGADKLAKSWQRASVEWRVLYPGDQLFDIQLWRLLGTYSSWSNWMGKIESKLRAPFIFTSKFIENNDL